VLVTAGRTEEPLDPVRVLTNRSSGRMGAALAEAARARGATVTMVTGPSNVPPPHGVAIVPVTTAAEMEQAVLRAAPESDVVLAAAAVADYRPAKVSAAKLKRSAAPTTLSLEPNPDILAAAAAKRRAGQTFVGFALETSRGLANARAKLVGKGLDLVALNAPADGIGGDTNLVTLVERTRATRLKRMSKREVAEAILDRVLELRGSARGAGSNRRAAAKPAAPAAKPSTRATTATRSPRRAKKAKR
jgi:phosphopantothenoylcysteine decarboxylase/phosphopantothenate--cysteine ligase